MGSLLLLAVRKSEQALRKREETIQREFGDLPFLRKC